jgi:hypothetical protein
MVSLLIIKETFVIYNKTPHPVVIILRQKSIVIPPENISARCSVKRVCVGYVENEIPVNKTVFGRVEGLPAYDESGEIFYIVSRIVAMAMPERVDLLVPDDTIRNEDSEIMGCRSLARI